MSSTKLKRCPSCGCRPGEIHDDNCDVERCSVCGCQRYYCDCIGHDKEFAMWTGMWPGTHQCEVLNIDMNQFYKLELYKKYFIK